MLIDSHAHLDEYADADEVIVAANFQREVLARKLKKEDAGDERDVVLVRNPDILAGLGARRRGADQAPTPRAGAQTRATRAIAP